MLLTGQEVVRDGPRRVDAPCADGATATIRSFRPEDEPAVLAVLGAAFGAWPRDLEITPERFFDWKHRANPFGPSSLLVAERDGAVVGFHAYMPWRLTGGGQTLETVRAVDLAVDPQHRRRGISMALRTTIEYPAGLATMWSNPNDASVPGALQLGRKEVRGLSSFLHPCSGLTRTLARFAVGTREAGAAPAVDAGPAAAQLTDDALLARLGDGGEPRDGRLATVKDAGYLRWRYGGLPGYHAVALDGPDGSGLAIFRLRRHGAFWVAVVCELLLERPSRRLARRLMRRVDQASRADFLACNFASRRDAAACGFFGYRQQETLTTLKLQEGLRPDPAELTSWALSRGDLELL